MKTAGSLAGLVAAACGLTILLAACTVLAPQPDPTRFFVLTSMRKNKASDDAPSPATANVTSTLSIGVGPVKLPQYLRRPEVVTRTSPSQVALSSTDRWAEPLESAFTRVLSENLSQLLGTQQVVTFPWYNSNQLNYQIQVNVSRFETDPKGMPELEAQWSIRDGSGTRILAAKESDIVEPADPADPSPSTGLSHALSSLSREIAAQIVQLNRRHARG
jgi:uncharacterized lipoprotein YmbA